MNRVIGFPAWKWPCGLTLPRSDLGSLGSPIKLSFSQVVCNMDLGLGHLQLGMLGGTESLTGYWFQISPHMEDGWHLLAPHFPK